MNNKSLLIHPESKIIDASNGIKVITPSNNNSPVQETTSFTIDSIFQLPYNFYFINIDSCAVRINEYTVISNGFYSAEDAIGKTMLDVLKKEHATQLMYNDKQVMLNNELKIFDESIERLDNFSVNAFSFKMPWYDNNNNIIGIFGFSLIGSCNLTYASYLAKQIGLPFLSQKLAQIAAFNPEAKINDATLTSRQAECMYFLIRGKSTKEIGRILNLSSRTIETYLENLKFKLKCQGTAELIEMAIDGGFANFKLPKNKGSYIK